jgi:hypothetical protein
MTTDRLALATVLRDNGIGDQRKAENVATAIFDAIHDNVATKEDVLRINTSLNKIDNSIGLLRADIRSDILGLVNRMMTTGFAAMIVVAGALFAALHYWPPHG